MSSFDLNQPLAQGTRPFDLNQRLAQGTRPFHFRPTLLSLRDISPDRGIASHSDQKHLTFSEVLFYVLV